MKAFKSTILITFAVLLGIFAVLSCSQTIPSQFQVDVYRVDDSDYSRDDLNGVKWLRNFTETSPNWIDIDESDNSSKTTAFPGAKFSRSVEPQKIGFEGSDVNGKDVYKIYTFDGSTWATQTDLTKQSPFNGRLEQNQKLYAYYDVVTVQKGVVELFGSYNLAKYVPIVGSLTFKVRLNNGFAFNTSTLQTGNELPDIDENGDWDLSNNKWGANGIFFPRVPGLKYQIGSFESHNGVENAVMNVLVRGTPTVATENPDGTVISDGGIIDRLREMQVIIPEVYIVSPADKQGFSHLRTEGKLFTSCRIVTTPIAAEAQTINGYKYTEIPVDTEKLVVTMSSITSGSSVSAARFSNDLNALVGKELPSDFRIVYYDVDLWGGGDFTKESGFPGLSFKVKTLNSNRTSLTIEVTGIPTKKAGVSATPNDGNIKIHIPEKYIEGGENVSTRDEEVDVSTNNTKYFIQDALIITTPDGDGIVRAIKFINNVDSNGVEKARQLKINIASGGKFKTNMCEPGEEVPNSIIASEYRVPGFVYTFGGFSNNNSTLIINIKGAPTDDTSDSRQIIIRIPETYIVGSDSNTKDYILVNPTGSGGKNYSYALYELNVKFTQDSVGNINNPINATYGISIGNGEGVTLNIQTRATRQLAGGGIEEYPDSINYISSLAVLKSTIENGNEDEKVAAEVELSSRLKVWFTELEKTFNNTGDGTDNDFKYSIVSGGSTSSMSNNIGIRIQGVSKLSSSVALSGDKLTKIKIPYTDIQGGVSTAPDTLSVYNNLGNEGAYYTNSLVKLEIVSNELNYVGGSENSPLNGNSNDIIQQLVKIRLSNAMFGEIKGADLDAWFSNLSNSFLSAPTYSIHEAPKSSGNGSYIVVRVTGKIKSSNMYSRSVELKIPKECIKGASLINDQTAQIYYKLNSGITAEVVATEQNGYYGSKDRPLTGLRYVNLNNDNGINVRIELKNGEFDTSIFENSTNNGRVAVWFKSWNNNGILNPQYDIYTYGKNFVVVKVKGALTMDENADPNNPYVISIGIPSTDIKDSIAIGDSFTVTTDVFYIVNGSVSATLDNSIYVGSSPNNPLVASRYVPFDKNLRIKLNGAKFKESVNIDNWFAPLEDTNIVINGEYSILSISDERDSITINIKGALLPEANVNGNIQLQIDKNDVSAPLIENVPFTLYYKVDKALSIKVDDDPNSPYIGGAQANPIKGIRYMPLGKESSNIMRIKLENAVFKETLKSGMDVSSWFGSLATSGVISNATFTVYEGGALLDWVSIKINGVLTEEQSNNIHTSQINVEYKDLNLYVPDGMKSGSVYAGNIYYQVTGTVSAMLEDGGSNKLYYGTSANAISGVKQVKLGGGNGVLLRLVLTNAKFRDDLDNNVTKWFVTSFTDLKDAKCTIIQGGAGKDYAFIQVEGSLDSAVTGLQTSTIDIEASSIEGYLPNNIQVPVYYQITSEVTAAFVNGQTSSITDYFYGTSDMPVKGYRGIPFSTHLKIVLTGAKFSTLSDEIVTSWFTRSELANDSILINPKVTVAQIGKESMDIDIILTSALNTVGKDSSGNVINKEFGTTYQSSFVIPKEYIEDASLTSDIIIPLYYQISGDVTAKISLDDSYFGTIASPLVSVRYGNIGLINKEPRVKIELENGAFKTSLKRGDNVTSWFANMLQDTTSFFAYLDSVDRTSVVVRIEGSLITPVSQLNRSIKLIIPGDALDWYLEDSSIENKDFFYYRTNAELIGEETISPERVLNGDIDNKTIYGTRFIRLNNGNGYLIRIGLGIKVGNDTYADQTIITPPTFVFSENMSEEEEKAKLAYWFSELSEILDGAEYKFQDYKYGDMYATIRIKGALNTPKIDGYDTTKYPTINLHIPPEDISGYLPSDMLIPVPYKVENVTTAEFVGNDGYYGSENAPVNGIQHVAINNGNGQLVRIRLSNGVKFINDRSLYTSENLKNWFSEFTDINDDVTYELEMSLDRDITSYIDIRIRGTLNTSVSENQKIDVTIPKDVIYGYLKEDVIVPMYYRSSGIVSASVDSGSEYLGSSMYPISNVKDIRLNNGDGVIIRINLNNVKFKNTLGEKTDLSSWFTNFDNYIKDAYYTLEEWDASKDTGYIKVRVQGYLSYLGTNGQIDTQIRNMNIVIPKEEIDASLPNDITTPMYFKITNSVTANIDEGAEYSGSSKYPIEGIQNVQINNGNGVKIKINLVGDNSKFRDPYNLEKIKSWFSELDGYVAGTPEWSVIAVNDEQNSITVQLKTALSVNYSEIEPGQPNPNERTVNVIIPANDILNADFTSPVTTAIKVAVIGKVSASIENANSDYYGGESNPIYGIKDTPINDGNGFKLKIKLQNTTFRFVDQATGQAMTPEQIKEKVTSMFSEFRELSNKDISVISGAEGDVNELVLNVKGELKFNYDSNNPNVKEEVNITIPKDIINWDTTYSTDTITLKLYATVTGVPSISLDTNPVYKGSKDNPIEGVQYIPLNDGKGYQVKISLTNAKFNKDYFLLNGGTSYAHDLVEPWFQNLTQVKEDANADRKITIIAVDDNSLVVRINGVLTASPNEFTKDPVTGAVTGTKDVAISINGTEKNAENELPIIGSVEKLDTRIYYRSTGAVSVAFTTPGGNTSVYQGTEANPITGIQYKNLNDGQGQLIYLKLENSYFKDLSQGDDVSTWFSSFTENIGSARKFTIQDAGTDYLIIVVNGALTVRNNITPTPSIEVKVPTAKIYGEYDNEYLYTPLYYKTTDVITATLDSTYIGADENSPITGTRNITLGNGDGAFIRINLRNAIFTKALGKDGKTEETLEKGYIFDYTNTNSYWFNNLNAMIIGTQTGTNTYDYPVYEVMSGGTGYAFITIKILGAFNQRAPYVPTPINIEIPSGVVEAVLEQPLLAPVYLRADNGVTAEVEESNTYFGSEANPLSGVKNIYLNNNNGYQIKVNLTGGTFNALTADKVSKWFDGFTALENASYEISGGGSEGSSYVMITIRGAFNIRTSANTQFVIKIAAEDIKDAHFTDPVVANLSYKCEQSVSAEIYDTSANQGGSSVNIELIQYINIGDDPTGDGSNTDGIPYTIQLKNAKFVDSTSIINENSIRTKIFGDFLTKYNVDKDGVTPLTSNSLRIRYIERSADGSSLKIRLYGHVKYGVTTVFPETMKIRIPGSFIENAVKTYEDDGSDVYTNIDEENYPSLVVANPGKDVVTITIDDGQYTDGEGNTYPLYGSTNKPVSGIINTPLGSGGQGELVRVKLSRAKFGEYVGTNGNNIATWFTDLTNSFSSVLSYTIAGNNPVDTGEIIIRIAGNVERVGAGNIQLIIPYLYIKGATQDFDNVSTFLFYNGLDLNVGGNDNGSN